MIFVFFTYIAIFIQVVKIVVSLEQSVMLQNPIVLFTDVWTENGGSNLAVILGSKNISDVMQQSTDNCFFICAIPLCSCRRLQGMNISVNLVSQFVPLHLFQDFQQSVRNTI